MTQRIYERKWRNFLKATGLDITAHMLRHTYATILYDAEVDVLTAQKLLGHADVSTTMNVYAHATREAKRTSARLLDKVVGG